MMTCKSCDERYDVPREGGEFNAMSDVLDTKSLDTYQVHIIRRRRPPEE